MSSHKNQHAVVIGASFAGLMSARVLADHFETVTVIERDSLPASVKAGRKGVPQGSHIHVLLQRGQQIITHYFPGLLDEIARDGQGFTDFGRNLAWFYYGAWRTRFNSKIPMIQCTRIFLEGHVRKHLRKIPNVQFKTGFAVKELIANDSGDVRGVRVEPVSANAKTAPGASKSRARKKSADDQTLAADFVVDASGRGSQSMKWLTALGNTAPREDTVSINLAYTTRIFRLKRTPLEHDLSFIGVYPRPPAGKRAGFLYRVESGDWLVSLNGYFGDHAPLDDKGFLEFARDLANPAIYDYIKDAKALTPITRHKIASNQRRRYDRLARMPGGFVVLGDAVCSFNPIFGQGMTVSCIGAELLGTMLENLSANANGGSAELDGAFCLGFQKRLAARTDLPWTLTTTEDLKYRESVGRRWFGLRAFNWYKTQIIELCSNDAGIYARLAYLLHMQKNLLTLMTPGVIVQALVHGVRARFRSLEERTNTKIMPAAPAARSF